MSNFLVRAAMIAISAVAIVFGITPSASAETLADRNAYIAYLVPNSDVTQHLRNRLIGAAYMACEGFYADVPQSLIVTRIKDEYNFTSTEAWKVLAGANRYICPGAA